MNLMSMMLLLLFHLLYMYYCCNSFLFCIVQLLLLLGFVFFLSFLKNTEFLFNIFYSTNYTIRGVIGTMTTISLVL